jgi:DNA polymerase elongation subunit (family B)
MPKKTVSGDVIEKFLEGSDPQKYIVSIETSKYEPKVSLVINDPIKGKWIQTHEATPFLWMKEDMKDYLYGGDRIKVKEATSKFKITIKKLKVTDSDGNIPSRMGDGYQFLISTTRSFNDLLKFFEEGGIDVYDDKFRKSFLILKPDEQFMIQTGKRLFKGFDDYDDLHRFQFDLETEGLNPKVHAIFQIGIRDNRGNSQIFETIGNTEQERRDSERANIKLFFKAIDELKPDFITGYNSEAFDWAFIEQRCERLSLDIKKISKTLNVKKTIWRNPKAVLKLGNESEGYHQTNMWGYNVLDISHAVRRAQAINSDIKKWGLKYITQFSEIEKPNRVYVNGDKIFEIWDDYEGVYYFNDTNGEWFKLDPEIEGQKQKINSSEYEKVTGEYIIKRYLQDDLWETEKVDEIYNQAGFLLGKWIPTNFQRSTTMGTAGIWQLLMCAWSYEQDLGIPSKQDKPDFTGGLSRLLEVGYAKGVVKLDYAALYPNTELTHDIFPEFDISGVMKGMLLYIAETRDKYKELKNLASARGDSKEADKYDKKQLPIKILANSFFGAFGAPHIFPWGDIDCAEETTCRGRQYLRLMVRHFTETHGFRPLVGDTDGFNFAIPDGVENIKYIPKGNHRMTEEYVGQELSGVAAVVAEFNEEYMIGRMGLDIDDICKSTINFARKNYANWIVKKNKDGSEKLKLKLVGNTVKSKVMATYIEEFIDKAIIMLLDGRGKDFIEFYYDYVEKIFNYKIPIVKIASKSKVNESIDHYKNVYLKGTTKAGQQPSRKAHMELAIKEDLKIDLGDVIYYVNTGTAKSHADVKKVTSKEGKQSIEFNCEHIPTKSVERDTEILKDIETLIKSKEDVDHDDLESLEMIDDKIAELESQLYFVEYNVAKYIEALNNRIAKLFVCFDTTIRDKVVTDKNGNQKVVNNLVRGVVKNKNKELELEPRKYFTETQCELVAGKPFDPEVDQDDYHKDLMMFEDKEFNFWIRVNKVPNNIDVEEWNKLKKEYLVRIEKERKEGMINEYHKIHNVVRGFEVNDYKKLRKSKTFPKSFNDIAFYDEKEETILSLRCGHKLFDIMDIFKYEDEAKLRDVFYKTEAKSIRKKDKKYEAWIQHLSNQELETKTNDLIENDIVYDEIECDEDVINDIKYKKYYYGKINLPYNIVDAIQNNKVDELSSEDIIEVKDKLEERRDLTLREILNDSEDVFTF